MAQSQATVPDRSGRMYRPAYRTNTGKGRPGNNNSNNRPTKYCHIYLIQKETQCFYLHFGGLQIIDFKNCFI